MNYSFRNLEARKGLQEMWENGVRPKEIAALTGINLSTVYNELKRGQDGVTRLPNQRLKYDAVLAQRRMCESFERRGRKKRSKS